MLVNNWAAHAIPTLTENEAKNNNYFLMSTLCVFSNRFTFMMLLDFDHKRDA